MTDAWAICGVLALSFLAASCTKYDHEVKIADVRKPEVIMLKKEPNAGPVYSIAIRGRGSLAGEARISLMEAGTPRNREDLNGKVSFHWGGDWYSDTAEILYKPVNVWSGELIIEYHFSTVE